MRRIQILIIFLVISFISSSYAQTPSDYLICQEINGFKDYGCSCGEGSGILAAAGHFGADHKDTSCDVIYHNMSLRLGIDVQVTHHPGSDSDKWLLHEVERDFRSYYGLPDDSFVLKQINGNIVLGLSVAGWTYRWVSGNKVIQIQYYDSQMTKPEPLEVVRAYLVKHPSTLPPITSADLRTEENKTKWIKDEMERRLWLCDRWFLALQTGKVEEKTVYRNAVDSMQVFLDYREKYYGISAKSEKQVLWEYLQANNGTGIKDKLQKYKSWWSGNRDKAISVQ